MSPEIRAGDVGWRTVLVASAAHFLLFADRALPSALAPALRQQFGLSDTQLGALIGTAMIAPYAIGTLVAGHLLARANPFRVMAWSILAWTAAAATAALATNYGELVAARVAFGLGQAAFAPAALGLLATAREPRAAIATSVFTTGSASGRSGGLLLGGVLLALAGSATLSTTIAPWRLASLWLLIPNFVLALLLFHMERRSLPNRTGGIDATPGLGSALRGMRAAPRAYLGHYIASSAAVVIAQAGGAWMPSLINRRFGFDAATSAIIVGAIVLVAVPLGHLSAGRFAARDDFRRHGPAPAMAGGAIGALLCCLLLVGAQGLVPTILALAGLAAAGGFAAATSLIAITPIVASENRVAALSVFFATTTLVGYGVGPLITGIISDLLGAQADELARALMLVVGISAAVACIAALWGAAAWRATADRNAMGMPA